MAKGVSKTWSEEETKKLMSFVVKHHAKIYQTDSLPLSPDSLQKKRKPKFFFFHMAKSVKSKDKKQCKSKCQKMQKKIRQKIFGHLVNKTPLSEVTSVAFSEEPDNADADSSSDQSHNQSAASRKQQSLQTPQNEEAQRADPKTPQHTASKPDPNSIHDLEALWRAPLPDPDSDLSLSDRFAPRRSSQSVGREASDIFFGNLDSCLLARGRSPVDCSPHLRAPRAPTGLLPTGTPNKQEGEKRREKRVACKNSVYLPSDSESICSNASDLERVTEFLGVLSEEVTAAGIKATDRQVMRFCCDTLRSIVRLREQTDSCPSQKILRCIAASRRN